MPYDRVEQTRETPSLGRRLASSVSGLLGRSDDGAEPTTTEPDTDSLTPVADRSAGGFLRLLRQELRLLLRGQPLWWYLGAVSIVAAGVVGRLPRLAIVSIAAI